MKNATRHPLNEPARLAPEGESPGRFWFWRGASGRRYIHSVYDLSRLPPLPGAVYVAARRLSPRRREAVACGVLPRTAGRELRRLLEELARLGAEEVHVHLLAASPREARRTRDDLRAALGTGPAEGGPPWRPAGGGRAGATGFGEAAACIPAAF